jgi:DNA-binding GntR family transcriptional regulator
MTNDNPPKTSTEYNLKVDLSEKIVTRNKVYSILSKAIFQGDLKPGQRLVESN